MKEETTCHSKKYTWKFGASYKTVTEDLELYTEDIGDSRLNDSRSFRVPSCGTQSM